jgi:hypothetical protein
MAPAVLGPVSTARGLAAAVSGKRPHRSIQDPEGQHKLANTDGEQLVDRSRLSFFIAVRQTMSSALT